ncbi:protein O-mannosyl-transferase family [Zhouia sp. PK063]|uniref:protein O-mannosyl-transferase family n=1 Tax=Zhouia sp. PK063 TaxID=3373602 RepID=UPI0037B1FF2D
MSSLQFKRWNTITGWVVFLIAIITYLSTIEPTVSFWDCGEYISTSAKLEVGHPPGAPFFQMLGAFFAMFAKSKETIAVMVNHLSAFSSAFAVLFTFWTITNLALKYFESKYKELSFGNIVAILGSGAVGALAFAFSDSFWFSAVEAEVYGMASFMMALQLWLGLRWIDELDTPRGNKWLILMSLIVGLTFGIQFMGFLVIPSIALLYYFKTYKTITVKNFIIANIAAVVALLLVYRFSLTYVLELFSWSELFFVNSVGLPFNSGSIIMALLFIAVFFFGLRYTRKKGLYGFNTIVLCMMFMFIGFSSWLMLPIRANANVIINENDPSDARLLLAYYNREQYGSGGSPLYGAYYSDMFAGQDPKNPYKDDKPKYERDEKTGKYIIVNHYKDAVPNNNSNHVGFLPRMWSTDGDHPANYMKFTEPLKFTIKPEYQSNKDLQKAVAQFKTAFDAGKYDTSDYIQFLRQFSEYIEVQPPSLWDNIKFLVQYQWGYMYWRYFMWNFVGRQDDEQGKKDDHGNWLSGINFIDSYFLGPQTNLPSDVLNNKARNTYYFLPLLLGLVGVVFMTKNNPKIFWVLLVYFFFTGLAIQFYTNIRPFEPRERDYSVVGSFYVFAIWIGVGVFALVEEFRRYLTPKILAPVITVVCLLAVPTVMAYQNWDDHDRSGKYTAESMAKSYLDSTQKDAGAILFTIGDNDTFALWYAQEIENHRTDVRTINTSLFNTDWYIDQMKRKAYTSDPIPSQLTHDQYAYGVRDVIYYQKQIDKRIDIKQFMNLIGSEDPRLKMKVGNGQEIYTYPTNKIRIPVNKENVLKSGLVKPEDADKIVDYIDIDLPSHLTKNRILMLDIIANNDWKRPIYFTGGSFDKAEYIWMKDYLQVDGMVYKLVPIKTPVNPNNPYQMGRIDTDLMYNNVKKWEWGNSGDTTIYHDPETRRNSISYRERLTRLSDALIKENKLKKAEDVLNIGMKNMPFGYFGYYTFLDGFVDGYYKVGDQEKARKLYKEIVKKYQEDLDYYASLDLDWQVNYGSEIVTTISRYRSFVNILVDNNDEELGKEEAQKFNEYLEKFKHFYKQPTMQAAPPAEDQHITDTTDATVDSLLQ